MRGITLVILAAGIVGTGADGYLARLGPARLRFAPPPAPRAVLPPLTAERPEEPAPMEEALPEPEPVEPAPAPASVAAPIVPKRQPPPAPSAPPVNDTNAIVSPQSLLRFFNQRTVGSNTMIFPLEFIPAAPPPRPSSSVTYGTSERR